MELKELSSNWKKLQQRLQKDQPKPAKGAATSGPLKRKSSDAHPPRTEFKRQRTTTGEKGGIASKHRRMENGKTTEPPTTRPPTVIPSTIPTDDSNPASILAPSPAHPDVPNQGLSPTAAPGKYIALDCEMVGIGPDPDQDSQLARVSVVNYHGHQLYDSYVQPVLPVTDYRTHVSGIKPHHLHPSSARPFREVQRAVADLLQGRILVGHALKHDLGVLLLSHPKRDVRDTARHPAFRKLSMGKTPSLKKLAKEVLGVEFQTAAHSSVEDARVTMALFRKDKEGFDREHLKTFGRPKMPVVSALASAVDGEGEAGEGSGEAKKKKKKKKKKGRK